MTRFAIVFSAALAVIPATAAHAQKLEAGKWTGSVTPPNEQGATAVTFEVTMKGDTLGITLNAGEHGTFAFSDVALADQNLTFWFEPGPRVDCKLALREDGAYAGSCRDTEGGVASMVMIPPQKS